MVIITSYPTRANGIIVLVNSQTGFCCRFLFPQFYKGSGKSILAHYFPYDVKRRLLAHSQSSLANQKARNAIVGAENLLKLDKSAGKCNCQLRVLASSFNTTLYVNYTFTN